MPIMLVTEIGWLDKITDALDRALAWVIALLPESPFRAISNTAVADYMSGLNWVFPISEILAIMQVWLLAIGVFYIYQAILRWVKAIE